MTSSLSGSGVGCPRLLPVRRPGADLLRGYTGDPTRGLVVRCGNPPTSSPRVETPRDLRGPLRRNQYAGP